MAAITAAPSMTKKMGLGDLLRSASTTSGVPAKDARKVLQTMLDDIVHTVAQGGKVVIPSFGTFEPRRKSQRMGRNPKTGEPIEIEEHTSVGFKAGTKFRKSVR
jgi:nucleoid DNA-binding protein